MFASVAFISQNSLIGVYPSAKDFDRRSRIQLTYLRDKSEDIDLYFVIRQPETEMYQTLVSLDMSRYSDIIVLNITENLTEAKTYEFFKTMGLHSSAVIINSWPRWIAMYGVTCQILRHIYWS